MIISAKKICSSNGYCTLCRARHKAHALCCHISEQQETELFTSILGTAVELTTEDKRIHNGYSAVSNLGITLPCSRSQEYEADYLGLMIATEAGYSPKAAIKFFEQLGKISKNEQEFEFFSTHPSAANRKKALEKRFYEFQFTYDQLKGNQTVRIFSTLTRSLFFSLHPAI